MIEQVDKRLWVYGESLLPGVAHQWVQDTSWGRARWFLAFPYAYITLPPEKAGPIQIESVFITRSPVPNDPDDTKWRIHVIVRNNGTGHRIQSYSIWVAQTAGPVPTSSSASSIGSHMKAFVVHGADGSMASLGVPFDDSEGPIELIAEGDQRVSPVSIQAVPELLGLETGPQLKSPIMDNFVLEEGEGGFKLIPKYHPPQSK
jgi:hypothetical protein